MQAYQCVLSSSATPKQNIHYQTAWNLEDEIYKFFNIFPKISNVEIQLKGYAEPQFIHTVNLFQKSLQDEKTKTVVLLHGYGGTSLTYYRIIKNLSYKFDTYALDLLGMGLSSRPKYEITDPKQTIDFFVESIEQWRKKMEKEKIVLVGHSFGGYMAFNYALKYPQNIENLILLSPMGITQRSEEEVAEYEKERTKDFSFFQRMFFKLFRNIWKNKKTPNEIFNTWYIPANFLLGRYLTKRLQIEEQIKEKWQLFVKNCHKLPTSSDVSLFYLLRFPRMSAVYSVEKIIDDYLKENPNFQRFPFQTHFLFGDQDWMCSEGAKKIVEQQKINAQFYQVKKGDHQMEEFFNDALQKRQEYQAELEKWTQEKKEKEDEFLKDIEALANDEEAQKEKQNEYDAFLEQYPEAPKEQEFLFEVKEYVLCADTMGQDREISLEHRQYLESYVQLFAKSWEETEKRLMSQDIDRYLEYLKEPSKDVIDQLNDEETKAEEDRKPDYDNIKDNEKEYTYRLESVKLETLKEILTRENVQKYIYDLKEYRILKFPVILQNVLYLLGYTMEQINIPNTHVLNWKHVKTLLNENFFNQLVSYTHQGSKPDKVKPYALVNKISAKMEKYNQQEIDEYNVGYGRLFKWVVDTCRLRKVDIEVRRQQFADRMAEIEKKEAQLEQWENDKATKLQEAKEAAATSEDPDSFVEEEWVAQWEEENPRPIVPERVEQDIDEDCSFE